MFQQSQQKQSTLKVEKQGKDIAKLRAKRHDLSASNMKNTLTDIHSWVDNLAGSSKSLNPSRTSVAKSQKALAIMVTERLATKSPKMKKSALSKSQKQMYRTLKDGGSNFQNKFDANNDDLS